MRIGLVRHFQVNILHPKSLFLSHAEICEWFARYDNSTNLKIKPIDNLKINWQKCYTSPLVRAQLTAREFYKNEIILHPSLTELNVVKSLNISIKLPLIVWAIWAKIKSFRNTQTTLNYKAAINMFLNDILQNEHEDTLIVCHYFTIKVLREELLKRGYCNKNYKPNAYGEIFLFEKKST